MARPKKKDFLYALAMRGVVSELRAIEHALAAYHRLWPDLFVGKTAPQLLVPEAKETPTGDAAFHWPPVLNAVVATKRKAAPTTAPTPPTPTPPSPPRKRRKQIWTKAMREAAGERMRARHKAGLIARGLRRHYRKRRAMKRATEAAAAA